MPRLYNHGLRLNLGEIDRLIGRPAEALEAFKQVLTAPDASTGQKTLANRYVGEIQGELGNDEEAISHLRAALAIDASQLAAQFHLADALRRNGSFQEAVERYEAVIRQVPGNPAARFGRLFALIGAGQTTQSLKKVEEDMVVLPNVPTLRHIQARLLATVPDDSKRDGARAQSIMASPQFNFVDSALAATRAMIAAEIGNFAEAMKHQRQAIELAVNEPEAVKTFLNDHLTRYQRNQPCRTPWPPDHPLVLRRTFR